MTTLPPQGIHSVERVDLTGTGDNSLLLDVNDLLDASGGSDPAFSTVAGASHNTFLVMGNAGDVVTLGEGNLLSGTWSHVGNDVALNGLTDLYDVYNFIDDGTVVATIGIGADLTVDLL